MKITVQSPEPRPVTVLVEVSADEALELRSELLSKVSKAFVGRASTEVPLIWELVQSVAVAVRLSS